VVRTNQLLLKEVKTEAKFALSIVDDEHESSDEDDDEINTNFLQWSFSQSFSTV